MLIVRRFAVFLLCSSVCLGNAQAQTGSSRLASVNFSGSGRYSSEQISAATGLHAGVQVSRDDLQKVANTLSQLGSFTKVGYRYSSADDGVHVEYQVTDAPALPVWFDNFPWFADEELLASLKSSLHIFDGTLPDHGTLLDTASATLEQSLAARGIRARVSHEVGTDPLGDTRIQEFHVDSGALNVAGIEFSDSLAQSDRAIQQRLSDLVGKPFSRHTVEIFEFEQVRPTYLSHGFLRVQFGLPSGRLVGASGSALPNNVVVAAPVDPGPAFAWNGVTWTGNFGIASADLDKLTKLKRDDPADGVKIEGAWLSVSDAYTRRGNLDVDVKPVPQFDETAKRVTYAVAITEGSQYRMGKLILTGLSMDGERRIRTAWKIPAGSVFDKSVFDEFISTGIEKAFTGFPYRYEKIGRLLQPDPKAGTVDVLLDFQ